LSFWLAVNGTQLQVSRARNFFEIRGFLKKIRNFSFHWIWSVFTFCEWKAELEQTCEGLLTPSSDSLMDSSLTIPSSWPDGWNLIPEKEAGALPANTSGGDGVVERNLPLRFAVDADDDAAAWGGESLLLLTLPRHEKAPLLLLLLWLLCQAASSVNKRQKIYSNEVTARALIDWFACSLASESKI
jgi:hypothetical protein